MSVASISMISGLSYVARLARFASPSWFQAVVRIVFMAMAISIAVSTPLA